MTDNKEHKQRQVIRRALGDAQIRAGRRLGSYGYQRDDFAGDDNRWKLLTDLAAVLAAQVCITEDLKDVTRQTLTESQIHQATKELSDALPRRRRGSFRRRRVAIDPLTALTAAPLRSGMDLVDPKVDRIVDVEVSAWESTARSMWDGTISDDGISVSQEKLAADEERTRADLVRRGLIGDSYVPRDETQAEIAERIERLCAMNEVTRSKRANL